MNRKFIFILIIIGFIIFTFFMFWKFESYEIILENNIENIISGEQSSGEDYRNYSYSEDEYNITLTDSKGNQTIYVFDDNGYIENVMQLLITDSEDEAKYVASYFNDLNSSDNQFSRIVQKEQYVSLVYNLEKSPEYRELTRVELKEILMNNFETID